MAATYPADTFQEGVDLTIEASNQLAQVVRGDANTEVVVADGSTIPSIRKAQADSMYFKEPELWTTGQTETDYLQLKKYIDPTTNKESWWFAKGALASNPIAMGTSPFGDDNWTLYTPEDLFISGKAEYESIYQALKGKAAEAGYNLVRGSFEEGGTLTNTNDVLWYQADGKYYNWFDGSAKTVVAGSSPATSGGVGAGSWVDRTDDSLRDELEPRIEASEKNIEDLSAQFFEALRRSYAEFGYNLVDGSFEAGGTVTSATDVLLYEATGIAYLWLGALPKVVPAGSTPASTGGIDSGAWVERGGVKQSTVVNVKNFGAKGDGITDDTEAIQVAVDSCCQSGRGATLIFPKGTYKITSPILFNPNIFLDLIEQGSGWHFSDRSQMQVKGEGRAVIQAGADMDYLFRLYVDRDADGTWLQQTSHGAAFTEITSLQLEDNGFNVTKLIECWFTPSVTIRNCNLRNKNGTGIFTYGVGVQHIDNNVIAANVCVYYANAGDNHIVFNDFYPVRNNALNRGVGIDIAQGGGNTVIANNVITGEADWTGDSPDLGSPSEWPVAVRLSGDYPSIGREVRDVVVQNNEFFRCFYGVYGQGSNRNLYSIRVLGNHTDNNVTALAYISNAREVIIDGNVINSHPVLQTQIQITLNDVLDYHVQNCTMINCEQGFLSATDCFNGLVLNNRMKDIGQNWAGNQAIYLNNTRDTTVRGNFLAQSSSSYGQTFVRESGGRVGNNVFTENELLNVNTPYVKVASDTQAVYIQYASTYPRSGILEKNYNLGDIVYNTTPSAGGSIGWICVTAGWVGGWKPFGNISP